jgi:class 3 adenylate cyclase
MSSEETKRKLAAIFSADVKDYSLLMRDDEVATVETITTYREVMGTLIKQHHGRVVDSPGDNILAEFSSIVDAVQSAVAIQKELKVRNAELPDQRRMEFRIGINLGDVIVEDGRLYGDGVNITARLEGLAEPGGICISRTAFDQIEDKLPLGYEYLGEKTVKNIVKPVRAYKVILEPESAAERKEKKASAVHGKRHRRWRDDFSEKHDKPRGRPAIKISQHLWIYLGVIAFLLVVNLLTSRDHLWAHWPALGWGFLLFLHWFNTEKMQRIKDRAKTRFTRHLGTYIGVIGFLVVINLLTSRDYLWVHWPALGWGLLLFIHWVTEHKSRSKSKD